MEKEFWLERWKTDRIGFHLDHPNPTLLEHWSTVSKDGIGAILVPLCGKSNDIMWLAQQNHPVIGIELSTLAIESFWSENALEPSRTDQGQFQVSCTRDISLWCGSFFEVDAKELGPISAFYDRASIIALPAELRVRYARKLATLIPSGSSGLMITVEYPQKQMDGPPFSVGREDVDTLFMDTFDVELLESTDIFSPESRLAQRGVTELTEHVFHLKRR